MLRIEILEKALSQNEAFLFFQTNKKTKNKHKKISQSLRREISKEIYDYCANIPDEIKNMSDDELINSLSCESSLTTKDFKNA